MSPIPDFEHTVVTSMAEAHVSGLAIALVMDRHIVYANTFGQTRSTAIPLSPVSSFQAASLSKPVFAYGVMQLVEQGVLDLNMPLSDIVKDPAVVSPVALSVTARHVLTHTTGFPNWREDDGETTLVCHAVPGTRFGYSGEGFEYLQRVVEHLTAQPLQSFLAANVFLPLGMHHSRFEWGVDESGDALVDADGIPIAFDGRTIASAAWSLHSTASDYARFLLALLHPRSHTPGYLRAESIEAMLTPSTVVGTRAELTWGLGWGIQQTPSGPAFFHWGGPQNGYTAYTATLIEQRMGIVILTNDEGGIQACQSIAEHALSVQQPAFDWLLPEASWTSEG